MSETPASSHRPTPEMPAMSDYGVVASTWVPLPWSWAAERLATNRNYWVASVDRAGVPASTPVWGVWDDARLCFAFSCSPNARKARNIATNPHVVVTSDSAIEAISIEGTAALLIQGSSSEAAREAWITQYVAKYGDEVGPDLAEFIRGQAFFEVVATRAYGMIERADEFATRATRWRFPAVPRSD